MKIYSIEKQEDGSVKVESVLTPEEMQFMLEFAMIGLMQLGLVPKSVAAYAEAHEEQQQQEFLANVDPKDIGQA